MRFFSALTLSTIFSLLFFVGCDENGGGGGGGSLSTLSDSASYAIGVNIGTGLKQTNTQDSLNLNIDLIQAGLEDAFGSKKMRFDSTVVQQVLMSFQNEMMRRTQERNDKAGAENKELGDKFLAENKSKEGVKTTPSGLQYIVRQEGSGDSPDSNDMVSVNYRGTLIDGTEFDKSQPGEPVKFAVNRVIPGWTEALLMMKPGAKWTVYIPGNIGYGAAGGPGGKIGPNATLIFDVELVSVEKQ